jgi:hypothetical protein
VYRKINFTHTDYQLVTVACIDGEMMIIWNFLPKFADVKP